VCLYRLYQELDTLLLFYYYILLVSDCICESSTGCRYLYSTSSHGKLQCDALKEIDHMYKNGINQTGTIFAVKALHGFTGLQESHFHG